MTQAATLTNWPGMTQDQVKETALAFIPFGSKLRAYHTYDWTVIVEGKIFPARALVLRTKGLAPNSSINSHMAIAMLKKLGFETRFKGKPV